MGNLRTTSDVMLQFYINGLVTFVHFISHDKMQVKK